MSLESAKIIATPSKITDLSTISETGRGDYKYTYNFGNRRHGDHQIDVRQDSQHWSNPQDVKVEFHCNAKNNQHITYAEINVDQSSTDHEAHIVEGGIGQRYIRIVVNAGHTRWFKYYGRIYAH